MDRFFLGTYTYTVDVQRRVPLHKDWRVGDPPPPFVLLPGRNRVIQMMPEELFREVMLAKAKHVSIGDAEKSLALARIGAVASHCGCDNQGRIKLTPLLMEHAGITGEVVMVGAMTTVQIMTPETWQAANADMDSVLDQIYQAEERGQL